MIVDIYRLFTIHIVIIHRLLSYSHQFQLQSLSSLWLLFQGRKINVLRNHRIDTCTYDQSQLIFGIVLFSIVMFLFPNFAVYFFLFAFLQLCSVFIQYFIYSISVLVKEFPYYILYMYICKPIFLADGIQFKLHTPQMNHLDHQSPRINTSITPSTKGGSNRKKCSDKTLSKSNTSTTTSSYLEHDIYNNNMENSSSSMLNQYLYHNINYFWTDIWHRATCSSPSINTSITINPTIAGTNIGNNTMGSSTIATNADEKIGILKDSTDIR